MARAAKWEVVDDDQDPYHHEGVKRMQSSERLRRLAELLDSRFRVLGIRIGWDAILGLVPGVGDVLTNVASFYILAEAARLGAPASVILRMGLNLLIDNLLDSIPLIGNIADIFWRANTRNIALLESYSLNPRRTTVRSRWALGLTVAVVLVSALACAALAVYFGVAFLRWLSGAPSW